jgi:hypothetical protein
MSIGNLKDSGNQGNNFPWQLKMLLGQQCACDELAAINANTDDVEFLLTSILTTLQASTEYEAKFVVDTCDSDKVYLEVRVWNPDTSTWGPITYYLPGSDTPVIPVGASTPGCLIYTDPSGILGMILAELQLQTPILTNIEINTGDTVTELQSILALYSAGPQACVDSFSVTLCTEQGATLSGILTELQSTLDVNVTNATLAVTQSGAWTVTSNQGTTPWIVNGTVNAAQSGTWNINNITGTVSLPTGAATEVTLGNIYTELQGGITVDAIDLDIRDLDCATDSVSICAGGNPLTSTTIGATTALDVIITPTNTVLNLENQEVSGADGNLSAFGSNITSISFFSNGTANALVSVNGGSTFVNVAPGTTINLDANSPSNAYGGTSFFWDTTTNVGSSLIIIYSYI